MDKEKLDAISQKFAQRRLNEGRFLHKLKTYAARLGQPAVRQIYALYYLLKSPHTPKRSKLIIVGALVYFLSPIDSIPDMLIPLGFTDDLAVIALAYTQVKAYLTEDIREQARAAAERLFGGAKS
ncbi:uncharacterized membrane protein YkvA (DUF1232 family) [Neisseria sp. HSC-16F19]|nr:YkvA family protein [Neisseria sp. HSC-16F19]MCP2041249.1 uncharacterized membrane protein YkvA (DUF1232 family) [Neisseria sp. HSC-16F19]